MDLLATLNLTPNSATIDNTLPCGATSQLAAKKVTRSYWPVAVS